MSLCDRSSALGRNYGREQKRDEAVTAAVTAADVTGTNPSDTAGSYGMFAYLCINQSIMQSAPYRVGQRCCMDRT